MRVPLGWLREYVDVSEEPARLAADLSACGLEVGGVERDDDDAVLDVDVTTNRVDCMNVYGVARELAVLYGRPLRPLELSFQEQGAPASEALRVEVQAPDLCGRFVARVLDVSMGASPAWMRRRLEQVGVRPISNVVDLTNYVMMEMGHPSHAFDLERVPEGRLLVRWAEEGESLTTLDGQARRLGPRCGVVAGTRGALALAGIMGGASSEVSDTTRVVALEAAWWEPLAIRRAARALGMHTDASHRFERAADFEGPLVATARIAHLLARVGAGSTRPGLIDVVPVPRPRRGVRLRPARVGALLGASVPAARGDEILRGLGFTRRDGAPGADALEYEVPTWRNDVAREADLVEEIGRHFGLDRIPSALPPAHAAGGLTFAQTRERALRRVLVGAGLQEVVNYAFVPRVVAGGEAVVTASGEPVALSNPLSEEQAVLRTSLVFPGLLANLQTSLRQGRRDVRLFESGRVFVPGAGGTPVEQPRLGLLLAGAARAHWSEKPRGSDFFDLAGLIEALYTRLGLPAPELRRDGLPDALHPGRAARVLHAGLPIGWMGALAPAVARAWECRDETLVAELDLTALLQARPGAVRVRALERFPGVARDLSLLCRAGTGAAELEVLVRAAAGELLRELAFVDRYEGPPVPPGHYSLTLGLRFQHAARTLAGDEVQTAIDGVIAALRAHGVEIRRE
jgi:phenylalanyl-tRNA synthetase beta chain